MTDETALSVLQGVSRALLGVRGRYVNELTARVIENDPDWQEPECSRRHVTLLWRDLQRSVTAEIGSALVRRVDDWTGDFAPRVVESESDDFEPSPDDDPYGFPPLAAAHHREAKWDFAPQEDSGVWLGWFEPEAASGDEESMHVSGLLSGFIVVNDGDLAFAHVVKRRRRARVASRLVAYAVEHHGLTRAGGPFTEEGKALATALNLDLA